MLPRKRREKTLSASQVANNRQKIRGASLALSTIYPKLGDTIQGWRTRGRIFAQACRVFPICKRLMVDEDCGC